MGCVDRNHNLTGLFFKGIVCRCCDACRGKGRVSESTPTPLEDARSVFLFALTRPHDGSQYDEDLYGLLIAAEIAVGPRELRGFPAEGMRESEVSR